MPLLAIALGLVVFGAQRIGGHPGSGLVSLAIMAGFGTLILLGGRSETSGAARRRPRRALPPDRHPRDRARGPRGDQRVIVAFIVELAKRHSGDPYGSLGAIGGFTYLVAIVVFRIRG